MILHRPIAQSDPVRPPDALPLAGGPAWFREVVLHERAVPPRIVPASDLAAPIRARLTALRPPLLGVALDRPRIMGIVNVTPDSFSDGGRYFGTDAAVAHAERLAAEGADILDIGGESTRPGAEDLTEAEERARILPVIARIRHLGVPISVDTRKAGVAQAALDAGAVLVNDVAALRFDPGLGPLAAARGVPVCLMHAQGDPRTMQIDPRYEDVLMEVAAFLAERVAAAEASGIPRARLIVDPGIGFGKTKEHNLALIRGLSALHDLGCAVMLGASRKRFIGTIAGVAEPPARVTGSTTLAVEALRQGVQVLRVHDVAETRQALDVFLALLDADTAATCVG